MTSVDEGLVGGKREPATEHGLPSVVDGAGEEEQVLPVIMCSRTSPDPVPECQLFPDESEESEEGVTEECKERESDRDSAAESSQGSDSSEGLTRHLDKEDTLGELYFSGDKCAQASISITSDLSTRSSASLNEEQFEDYGEGEEPEYTPSSPSPDDETRTNGYSDLGSSVPSSAGQTPRKVRHQYAGELMDVYCSQCSKKVNLLNDLDARLKNLRAHSPSRKISSTAFGRQLLHNSNLSSRNGSTEDLFRDSIDSCDIDINEKVSSLEKKVAELENEILMNSDLKSKLKQENTQLVHRVNELEEQLKDQETRAEQNFQEELRRHREAYSKMERDKNTQIELLTSRIKNLEEENSEMSASMFRLKSQTEKLDEEKQRMTDKLEDTSLRLKDEMDLYRKMMDKLKQNREQFQKEKDAMQELIEDLRRELEHLQLYKLEAEKPGRSRSSSSGLSDFNSRSREVELEHEVKRLKQQCASQDFLPPDFHLLVLSGAQRCPRLTETQKLREQNDDLNGQILSLSLHEAKNLFATQTKAQSLAAEIDSASRDQLMEALKEQEDINLCLRQYMDKVILSILDHNPSILEIKN
ncbi:PREDICTED: rab11 family-interacting protein 4 isoform X1 [Poecilia mexicana]|uniref:rab11 family-interacting protein 4 isoform X1 n=2 Tax=Poecilia mexicana TaxID=48701 RepID=UPI00072E3C03|nr:PREDICTED: rab11 family-interacting protein 4 isoform X1 [Poecilia mexicana]XP_014837689.1 PREDICTED: rab11 family-interacting protein 4 isoform X1 [Poecilia mexicana]XP_014837697.1 PREDICTED: rab11 family-interacting protein 4 isoform X1 [Poecilia mexicana]XP_014837707.1 PREDICTED: rab11 family-interacting protein 4 isoform X1 [Poecilia mexicana]